MSRRRVVVTGLGTVNACGNDVKSSWEEVFAGRSGITNINRFAAKAFEMPCDVAGELKGFDPLNWFPKRDLKKLDLMTMYGIAASSGMASVTR